MKRISLFCGVLIVCLSGCKSVSEPRADEAGASDGVVSEASKGAKEGVVLEAPQEEAKASVEAEVKAEEAPEETAPAAPKVVKEGVTAFCGWLAPEGTYENAEYLFEQDPDEGELCDDGKVYCYGADNMPILKPEAEGWGCRYVYKLPAKYSFKNKYLDYKDQVAPWYNDDMRRKKEKYINWSYMKAWVCDNENCGCGSGKCPKNAMYIDGECYCNDKSISSGGKCKLSKPTFKNMSLPDDYWRSLQKVKGLKLDEETSLLYYTSKKKKDGESVYYCGKSEIRDTSINHCISLSNGGTALYYDTVDIQEYDYNYYKRDSYLYDQARKPVICENENDENELCRRNVSAERIKNENNANYICGKETCVNEEICLNEHCVGLGTREPLPENYTWTEYMPECVSENGCACGKTTCLMGQYCIENTCMNTPYVQKVKGKWLYYGMIDNRYVLSGEVDENGEPKYGHYDHIFTPKKSVWFNILTDNESLMCDRAEMPSNVEDYICTFSYYEDDRMEGPQTRITAKGYYCNRDEGCACGKAKCEKNARCRAGQCEYDEIYLAAACHYTSHVLTEFVEINSVNRLLDECGWCRCGGSLVPPNMRGYGCDGSGMKCLLGEGCPCGDAVCAKDEVCVSLGTCR